MRTYVSPLASGAFRRIFSPLFVRPCRSSVLLLSSRRAPSVPRAACGLLLRASCSCAWLGSCAELRSFIVLRASCSALCALRLVLCAPYLVLRVSCFVPRAPCSPAPHLVLCARALSAPRAPRLVLSLCLSAPRAPRLVVVLCASCSAHLVLCLGLRAARALRLVLRCSTDAPLSVPRYTGTASCSVELVVDRASFSDSNTCIVLRGPCLVLSCAPRGETPMCLLLLSLCVYCRSHTCNFYG